MVDELQVDPDVDPDIEAIRHRIDESRESLAQKIEQLEEKVTETVESATATVNEATAAVMETVQTAKSSVTETVDTVTNVVQDTVESVRHSVEGTVDSVKETFNLSRQVEKHPWLMFGGAIAVGFFGGKLLEEPPRRPRSRQFGESFGRQDYSSTTSEPLYASSTSADAVSNGFHRESAGEAAPARPAVASSQKWGWFADLASAVSPELSKLQSLAIGAAVSAIRDLLKDVTPQPLQEPLSKVIDELTEKAGGTPVQGPLLSPETFSRFQHKN